MNPTRRGVARSQAAQRTRREIGVLERVLGRSALSQARGGRGRRAAPVQLDQGDFAPARDAWRRLQEASPGDPFQTVEWVEAYADSYGTRGQTVVVVAGAGKADPLGVAAFERVRTASTTVWRRAAAAPSDHTDVLLADTTGAPVVLVASLLQVGDWHVLDFPNVPRGARVRDVWEEWPGPKRRLPAEPALEFPQADWEAFVAGLPARTRKTVRKKLRRIESAGLQVARVEGDVGPAVEHMLDLHQRQWRGRGMYPEHGTARYRRFLVEAMQGMCRTGSACVVTLQQGAAVVAVQILVLGPDFVGAYLYGHEPALRQVVDVHLLLTKATFDVARDSGRARVSMLRGQEEHKQRLHPVPTPNERLLLARPGSVRGAALVGAMAARSAGIGVLTGPRSGAAGTGTS